MSSLRYLLRSFAKHWRAHLAAALGAAVATAALAGALLTGTSVRQSLRGLVLERLGATGHVLVARGYFRSELARAFQPESPAAALIGLEGAALHIASGRRAPVDVYAIDDSFYRFHGRQAVAPVADDALLSPALAAEFGAHPGDQVFVRVEDPSAIPREAVQGGKDETARSLRFRVGDSVWPAALDDFALRPRQGAVRAMFVPLARLQRELNLVGLVNTLLLGDLPGDGETLARRLRESFRLEDLGLHLRPRAGSDELVLEHASAILDERTAERALEVGRALGILTRPSLVYLVNSIGVHGRRIPYSLVAAVDDATLAEVNSDRPVGRTKLPPLLLNEWAAADLGAKPGDTVSLEYFVPGSSGELQSEQSDFELAAIAPIRGLAADRDLAPHYSGPGDQVLLAGWRPPFPLDLKRLRPRDEQYWRQYGTTPKAWAPLETARKLWGTRFGSYTSIRFSNGDPRLAGALRNDLNPLASQFTLIPVRRQSLEASRGTVDFGLYFLGFSALLIAGGLLLMVVFCRRPAGQSVSLAGGLLIELAGSLLGALLAPVWAAVILHGLRSWWRGATGTRLLYLSWDPSLLAAGWLAGTVLAAVTMWQALRVWGRPASPTPSSAIDHPPVGRWLPAASWAAAAMAFVLLALSLSKWVPAAAAFFGAGVLLLCAFPGAALHWPGIALQRTSRNLLCLALIAPGAFLLVTLEAFRQLGFGDTAGYSLFAESLAPLIHDPNAVQGRAALNLTATPTMNWTRFRLRSGDDVSGLNLYRPRNPRILGVPEDFLARRQFHFAGSTGESPQTRANPWLLLNAQLNSGVIPAIVDQNSLTSVLHGKLGDEFEMEREGSPPLRLKFVAALQGSPFQSEILINEKDFIRIFPQIAGWRVFLLEGPAEAQTSLGMALSSYGFEAQSVAERLAGYHRTGDTLVTISQVMAALGLLLGAIGLVFSPLRSAGSDQPCPQPPFVRETALLLATGLLAGAFCGLVAVAPSLVQRRSGWSIVMVAGLLAVVFAGGVAASWVAARPALRSR